MISNAQIIEWVTKIYYLELLRASEDMLSRWPHLQSLTPPTVSRRINVRQAAGCKTSCCEYNMIKNMLCRPHLVG
jgi:hypothetical protein